MIEKLTPEKHQEFVSELDRKTLRKIKAREKKRTNVFFGFGMFGLIGWAVAVPTLAGVALGLWLDRKWPTDFSWALALLVAGLFLGCWNAWYWINKERP